MSGGCTVEQSADPARPVPGTVADVMVRRPWVLPGTATVGEARGALQDGHVHMALLVEDGRLRGTLTRSDLPAPAADGEPAAPFARLDGRIVAADVPAEEVRRGMVEAGIRRLAVVDADGGLVGLLCLKRRLTGFCSDDDVTERQAERQAEQERVRGRM
ncbi:CBS domain-containing protein [Nocardioides sp. SYSU DS0663]|uniref:CBS domain-containing protein n=1 Tax=Nocardioides sp. SYSU DS0663 TaxID=3416445 RepID=UPI003F4C81E8